MSGAFLQRNIMRVLKKAEQGLSPKEIYELVFMRWRKPSRDNVRRRLTELRDKGCVICTGRTSDRKCKATNVRPVSMRGKSPGSAFGRAIAIEVVRQEGYRYCGTIPTGTTLERFWPMMFGQHAATDEDEGPADQ